MFDYVTWLIPAIIIIAAYYAGWKRGTWMSHTVISDLINKGMISRNEETGDLTYTTSSGNISARELNYRLITLEELTRELYKKQIGLPVVAKEFEYAEDKAVTA